MTPREELQALRDDARLAALEARAAPAVGGSASQPVQSAPESVKPFQRAGGRGPLLAGVGDAAIKGVLGLKQLINMGSAEDQAVLREMKAEEEADPDGGWRTAGNVAGNIAMTAVPGAKLAKGIQGVRALGAAAPLAAAAGGAALTEAAVAPVEGDSYPEILANKAVEGGKAGLFGGALHGVLGTVGKAASGLFKVKPDAARLYAEGINPTLQQGAAGAPGRFIGVLTAGVQNLKTRLNDEVGDAVVRRATEGNVSVTEGTGEDFANAAKDYVSNQYDSLWSGKRVQLSPRHREAVVARAGVIPRDGVGREEAAEAVRIMENRMGVRDGVSDAQTNYPLNPQSFREKFRTPITKVAMESSDAVRGRILEARALLDKLVTTKNLTKAERARLAEINSLNFDAQRLKDAAGGGNEAKEGINLTRLNAAYTRMLDQGRSIGNTTFDDVVAPAVRINSTTPNQNTARSAKAMAGKIGAGALAIGGGGAMLGAGAALPAAAVYGLSGLGQWGPGAKALLGQYPSQKKLAELLRKYEAPAEAVLGSSLNDQE